MTWHPTLILELIVFHSGHSWNKVKGGILFFSPEHQTSIKDYSAQTSGRQSSDSDSILPVMFAVFLYQEVILVKCGCLGKPDLWFCYLFAKKSCEGLYVCILCSFPGKIRITILGIFLQIQLSKRRYTTYQYDGKLWIAIFFTTNVFKRHVKPTDFRWASLLQANAIE
jgi:hypothetical protein